MTNIIGAPDRYIQGPGEIGRLHEYGSRLGNEFLVVAEEQTMASWRRLAVSEAACTPGNFMSAMPFDVSPADVLGATLAASVTGHLYQEEGDGHAGHEEEED
jgi:hypothetical protein